MLDSRAFAIYSRKSITGDLFPVELRTIVPREQGDEGELTTIQRTLFSPPPLGPEGNNRVSSFHPQSLPAIARGMTLGSWTVHNSHSVPRHCDVVFKSWQDSRRNAE